MPDGTLRGVAITHQKMMQEEGIQISEESGRGNRERKTQTGPESMLSGRTIRPTAKTGQYRTDTACNA